jgi:hypothetical protein
MSYFLSFGPYSSSQVGTLPSRKVAESTEANQRDSLIDEAVKNAVLTGLGYFAAREAFEILVYFLEIEHNVDFAILDNPKSFRWTL